MVLIGLCWAALISHAISHSGNGHTPTASASASATSAMWTLMAVAMMAPTAVPVLISLRDILRSQQTAAWWGFLAGYLAIWVAFGAIATVAQRLLATHGTIGHYGAATSRLFNATVFACAGAYQFTSLKRRCVTECVRPMTFFLRYWRAGTSGGIRMGARHGVSCLGCCWALMLLAFVGGLTNVWWMVLCAALMALEKVPATSRYITVPLGLTLIGAGCIALFVPATSTHDHQNHHSMSIESTKGTA